MSLSEDDKHILEDIERHFLDNAPRRVSGRRPHLAPRPLRRVLLIGIGLLAGILLLFLGLRLDDAFGTATGVLGGVIVIGATKFGVTAVHRSALARRLRSTSDHRSSPPSARPRGHEHP